MGFGKGNLPRLLFAIMLLNMIALQPAFMLAQTDPFDNSKGPKPIPAGIELKQAQSVVNDLLRGSPPGASLLAKAQGALTRGDDYAPAVRYLLYQQAVASAGVAGKFDAASEMIGKWASEFTIDSREQMLSVLATASISGKSPAEDIVTTGLQLCDDFLIAADLTRAGKALVMVEASVKSLPAEGSKSDTQRRIRESRDILQQYQNLGAAMTKLQSAPSDAASNLLVGRYKALVAGDFEGAIPLLLMCGDATLKTIAGREADNPTDPNKAVELGDLWWNQGERLTGRSQSLARTRAVHWYRLGASEIKGNRRELIAKRIQMLEPQDGQENDPGKLSGVPASAGAIAADTFLATTIRSLPRDLQPRAVQSAPTAIRWTASCVALREYLQRALMDKPITFTGRVTSISNARSDDSPTAYIDVENIPIQQANTQYRVSLTAYFSDRKILDSIRPGELTGQFTIAGTCSHISVYGSTNGNLVSYVSITLTVRNVTRIRRLQ